MKFDEKTAENIRKKYNLSKKTVKVWKSRNKIPDRYFEENYSKRVVTPVTRKINGQIRDILQTGKIHIANLSESAGVKQHLILDMYARDESDPRRIYLSSENTKKIVNQLKKLQVEITETFKTYNLKNFTSLLQNPLIYRHRVVKRDKKLNDKFYYIVKHSDKASDDYIRETWNEARDHFFVFRMELGRI